MDKLSWILVRGGNCPKLNILFVRDKIQKKDVHGAVGWPTPMVKDYPQNLKYQTIWHPLPCKAFPIYGKEYVFSTPGALVVVRVYSIYPLRLVFCSEAHKAIKPCYMYVHFVLDWYKLFFFSSLILCGIFLHFHEKIPWGKERKENINSVEPLNTLREFLSHITGKNRARTKTRERKKDK